MPSPHMPGPDDTFMAHFLPYLNLPSTERLNADANLRSYGLESLGLISLLTQLEEHYGIELPDDFANYEVFETPRSAWIALQHHLA